MSTKIFRSAGDATHLMWSASITVVQKQPISSKVCRTSHFLLYVDGFTWVHRRCPPYACPQPFPASRGAESTTNAPGPQ
ncbi:hypothetical protein D1K53_07885 [Salmonella enterica]|nr:hypothetical protein [Salmonella enterica]